MASSNDSETLEQFQCFICNRIPTEFAVKTCSRGHIMCILCGSNKIRCKCGSENLVKIPNPLLKIVQTTKTESKKECVYKAQGCNWLISESDDMTNHTSECKFRPYLCEGAHVGVWKCDWTGMQHEFIDHMKLCHANNGEFYSHWHTDSVLFDPNVNCKRFNLIDAFFKKFVFLYMSHAKNPNVVFIIYMLGRKVDAKKYMIDFELKNDLRKVKFIETCFSDGDDIANAINDHRCIVLPKNLVASYAKDGQLEFRFVIKKKYSIEAENNEKQQHLQSNLLHGSHAVPPPFATKKTMKPYQSESNLVYKVEPSGQNNGSANNNPRYMRH